MVLQISKGFLIGVLLIFSCADDRVATQTVQILIKSELKMPT